MNLEDCKRIILFGGSFDPPHMAHVALPLLAMETAGAEAVAYIPAASAPHKRDRVQTPVHQRLAMLRLAMEPVPQAVVLADEIDRASDDKPSFTVDTLAALRQRFGEALDMRLLIGTDMLRIFSTWRDPERVVALAEPLVMVRPPDTRELLLAGLPTEADRRIWAKRLIDLPRMDVSSSDIRDRVAKGKPITGMVMSAVEDYIRREGLYRGVVRSA